VANDHGAMECSHWQELISQQVDGEAVGSLDVASHIRTCASCRAYSENAHRLRRATSIRPAVPMPDLSWGVRRAVESDDRASVWWVIRAGLVVVAAQITVLNVPALVLGRSEGSTPHAARHLGSFAIAYAVGLFVVAARPAKARSLLPVTGALAACLVVTAIADSIDGNVPLLGELAHLPEVVGVILVWMMASPHRRPTPRRNAELPPLQLVSDTQDRSDTRAPGSAS
jgi:predicted anti-sigma-YlaC factor YlaD